MSNENTASGTAITISTTLEKKSGTLLTLNTQRNYVNTNIAITINAQAAAPAFKGGALNNKAATATFTNMSVSESNTSGIAIQAKGSAGRDAIVYDGNVNGWVEKNDEASAAEALASSEWNGTTYYASGVTLINGKTFDITVPNGNEGDITFRFSVDAEGNTTVTTVES